MTNQTSQKIIAIFGDGGSGKTAYVDNLEKLDRGIALQQIDESLYTYTHNSVETMIVIGPGYGEENHRQYFENARFACIFVDCTRMTSVLSVESWISYARRTCRENIPILLCMNKCMSAQSNINSNSMIEYNHANRERNIRMICVDHMHGHNSDFIFYV